MLGSQRGEAGLLSASADPEMTCWASAASRKKIQASTATQLLSLDILRPHLSAERSIPVAPQVLRPTRCSLKAPDLLPCLYNMCTPACSAFPQALQRLLLLLSVSAQTPFSGRRTRPLSYSASSRYPRADNKHNSGGGTQQWHVFKPGTHANTPELRMACVKG